MKEKSCKRLSRKRPEDSSVPPQLSEHMCYLNFVFPSLTVVLAVFFILRSL